MGEIARQTWDEFLAGLDWRQGEHVGLIGPTGSGKTTLAQALLPLRSFVLAVGTKPPRDKTLNRIARLPGWRLVDRADRVPKVHHRRSLRVLLWVKFKAVNDAPRQAYQIGTALAEAFTAGGWTIYIDEAWYLETKLKLKDLTEILLTQGRSENLTIVGGSQRPAHISLLWYDQPTHMFFWGDNDERNLKRIAGMNGVNTRAVRETVATLPPHHVLYVNTRTKAMCVTKAPAK